MYDELDDSIIRASRRGKKKDDHQLAIAFFSVCSMKADK